MLTIENATVRMDGKTILDAISLRFARGTLNVLVGPNGAGKSTLVAALAGDLAGCRAHVTLAGTTLQDWKTKPLARVRAVLTQDHAVRFAFSVREVVAMGRLPHPPAPEVDDRLVVEAMVQADVTEFESRNIQTLSGGEASRTAFARVLAQDTPVILLDEPTAALDLYHQEKLLRGLRRLADADACVIAVLHDLNLAAAYAHRMVMLSHGRVVADGTPREVLQQETIESVYGQPVLVIDHPTRGTPLIVSDDPREA